MMRISSFRSRDSFIRHFVSTITISWNDWTYDTLKLQMIVLYAAFRTTSLRTSRAIFPMMNGS
jgi:hypothetical protein